MCILRFYDLRFLHLAKNHTNGQEESQENRLTIPYFYRIKVKSA